MKKALVIILMSLVLVQAKHHSSPFNSTSLLYYRQGILKEIFAFLDIAKENPSWLSAALDVAFLLRSNISVITQECMSRETASYQKLMDSLAEEPKSCVIKPVSSVYTDLNKSYMDIRKFLTILRSFLTNLGHEHKLQAVMELTKSEGVNIENLLTDLKDISNSTQTLIQVPQCLNKQFTIVRDTIKLEFLKIVACIKEELAKDKECGDLGHEPVQSKNVESVYGVENGF